MMQTVMHTQTLSTANAWQQRSHACQRLRCHLQQQHTISHSRCSSTVVKASEAAATAARSPVVASRFGDLSWASCVSSKTTVTSAVQDAVDSIMQHQQGDFQPDLALVFASCNYGSQLQDVVRAIRRAVPSVRKVFGCSSFGVLGSSPAGALEIEGEPGISLTLAALPGVELSVMHTLRSTVPTEDASPEAWWDLVGITPVEQLQRSPQASALDSDDEEEQHQQQQQQGSSSSGSSSSNGSSSVMQASSMGQPSSSSSGGKDGSTSAGASGAEQADPAAAAAAVSFLVLCDPRFQQSKQLLAGLDFAFPNAPKVGAVLSQGQQNKRRLMYVWSADGSVQPGTAAWVRQQQKRRRQQQQQQQPCLSSEHSSNVAAVQQPAPQLEQAAESEQQQQQPPAAGAGKKKSVFGNLFNALLSGLSDGEEEQQQQRQGTVASGSQPLSSASAAGHTRQSSAADEGSMEQGIPAEEGDDAGGDDDGSGVFMYGAAVLSMKGPLRLEPVTCQGYRTVSDKVWTVGQTSRDGDLIGTLIDPDADDEEGNNEVVPLLAVYDLLMAAGFDPEEDSVNLIEELSTKLAVAIAPDSWRPSSELQTDDYQVAAISEVWQKTGWIRVDSQARPGYRMRLVLRDEAGIREDLTSKLLAIKRTELAGVLTGKKRPPPLATLLFSDIGRGSMMYETPSYESGMVSSYLAAPLAGMFGSAQISTANSKAALYELTCALAVLRPAEGSKLGKKQQQ